MLPLWSKPATLALSPEGIALRHPASPNGKIRQLSKAASTPRTWENLLTELTEMAPGLEIGHVRILLSNQYMRYAILPWQNGVLHADDWQALGEHHMRKLFGTVSEAWEVRVSMHGYGESMLISAIDREPYSRLLELAAQYGWTIQAIEPVLMAVFNTYLKKQVAPHQWILIAEPQRLLLAGLAHQQWQHLSVAMPPAGLEQEEELALIARTLRTHTHPAQIELAYFGTPAFIPQNLPENIRLTRLSQFSQLLSASPENSSTLTMLANL